MSPRTSRAAAAVLCVLVGGLAACSGSAASGQFDDQAGSRTLSCLEHQASAPGKDYSAGEHADTTRVLRLLRYYSGNGNRPYCDGKPPSKTDRAWARRYVDLGADRTHVARILG